MKRSLALVILLLAGCIHMESESNLPALRKQQFETPQSTYISGSIWQASSAGIIDDFKARKRGDSVTIVISEIASASKGATTGTERTSSVSAGIPNLLGLETNMTGIKNWMDLSKLVNASTESKYAGTGSTTRTDNLSATITARVVDVLANGNLLIEGKRSVKVNNEDQFIVLEGMIRPKDITADNYVNSTLIADAKINYSGKGLISDRQRPGWLMNAIDFLWPF